MNIEFLSIGVKNFRSYGNIQTKYEFYNGLDLITGTNGNGKTSLILHGIIFNLFGVGVNGENVDSLINDVNKKNMEVELELLSNGKHYRILRGRKPNKLEIYEDGSETPLPSISSKADDAYVIETILGGIDKNVFLKLFTIQANNSDISIFRMSAGDRRKLLESLFDLSIYSEMKIKNEENIGLIELDKINIERDNKDLSNQLNLLINNLATTKKFIENLNIRLDTDSKLKIQKLKEINEFETTISKEIKVLEKEYSEIEEKIKKFDIKSLNEQKTFFDEQIKNLNKKINEINISVENLKSNINLLQDVKKQIKEIEKDNVSETEYNELTKTKVLYNDKIRIGREEISKIDSKFKTEEQFLLNIGECANGNKEFLDCVKKKFGNDEYNKEDWVSRVKPKLLLDIEEKEKEIKDIENKIKKFELLSNNIKIHNQNMSKFTNNISINLETLIKVSEIKEKITIPNYVELSKNKNIELEKEIKEFNVKIDSLNKEIELFRSLEKDLNNLNNNIKEKNKLNSNNLNNDLKNIEASIKKTNKDIEESNINLEKNNKDIKEIEEKIKENNKKIEANKLELDSKLEVSKFLKDEKIKYFIMKQSFPILKSEFNKILKRLFHGEIRVEIDNKFDISVYKNGILQNFENFSEGEKKRLDLGFIFTVHEFLSQKNQIVVNLMVMDELLDSALDSVGTDIVIEYLNEMKLTRNIILVTHRAENIDHDRRFIINKDQRFSELVEVSEK